MKKFIFLALAFFCLQNLNAQQTQNQNWQNAVLRADGRTEVNNVEAWCQKVTCDGEEYVLIKFINKNDYRVGVEWIDAIWINGTWFYAPEPNNKKVLYLEAKSTVSGDCTGEPKLKVRISNIINNPADFQHYTVSGLITK